MYIEFFFSILWLLIKIFKAYYKIQDFYWYN